MRSPFAEVLSALARALRELGVRWYLFGAQAAIVHGAERLTNDVDVTVDLGARTSLELVEALQRTGFALRVADVGGFVARTRVLPVRHRKHGIDVDVVLAGPGPEQVFLERVVRRKIERVTVPVASVEDVIAMKVLAGRAKDLEDVAEMLAASRGRLGIGQVRETLGLLQEALGQSDLLPTFETVREGVAKELKLSGRKPESRKRRATRPRRKR